jgi:hypothetical protein
MHARLIALFLMILFASLPGWQATNAAPPVPGEKVKTDIQAATDAVTQPLTDLNVKRRDIAPLLAIVREDPYTLDTIRNCRDLIAEVGKLNAVLGPDFDQIELDAASRKRRDSVASAAGGLISSLVPFRYLIREISGAGQADRDYRTIIYAGVVRRGFLKGWGAQRGCAAPGRPLRPLESAQAAAAKVLEDRNVK